MGMKSNMRSCTGKLSCGLSWAVVALAVILRCVRYHTLSCVTNNLADISFSQLAVYVAGITFFIYRDFRQQKSNDSGGTALEERESVGTVSHGKIHTYTRSRDYDNGGWNPQSLRTIV
jgi:hypothetical protein